MSPARRRDPTPKEAVALQRELAARVLRETTFDRVERVAGVDVSVKDGRAVAAVAVLSWPDLVVLEVATAELPATFPYVPGLLGFREVPVVCAAYARLRTTPDVLVVDGHGLAHPRRFGVACHVGVELDVPAIGCAKSLLVGTFREPGTRRGASTRLLHRGEVVGRVLRTRDGVRPVFVSIGHRVDLDRATRLVLSCARCYRLPETTRVADRVAGEVRSRTKGPPRD